MSLANVPIPSLFNGVSQQPTQLRLPSQCEVSDNCYPTIAVGNAKRPPTRHKAKLTTSTDFNAYCHVINRDTSERYVILVRNGSLAAYDALTGAVKTVNAPSGLSYLTSSSPKTDFAAVTVADYTFIVNRAKKAAMAATTAPANGNVGYVSFSYNGAGVQRAMSVTANGVTASYSGASSDLSSVISTIQSGLSSGLGAGWSVTKPFNNLLKIERTGSSADWALTATDDYGGSTMKVIKGAVQLFSDLPAQIDGGYICYITSKPGEQGKGYYVKYDAASKSYVECPKPGSLTSFDPATLPHKLVREADGTFTFSPMTWETRKVGDDASNPQPSFISRGINDVFFYRNRLGVLADENVILSCAGDYFDMFAKSATAVIDSDPIDEAVANTKVSILRHAIPFNKALLLFSDQTQFQLTGGDVLSPKSVKADPVTEFVSSPTCRPVGSGQSLFFVTVGEHYSGIREYFVEQDSLSNDAADITAHVPAYLPPNLFKLSVSTSEDLLVALSNDEPSSIYAYKFYWGKDEKVQSAWFRLTFATGDSILGAEFIGSKLVLVVGRSDGIYLEDMDFRAGVKDTGLPFNVLLDRKVSLTGSYDAGTNTTTWTLPWPRVGTVWGVLGSAFGSRAGAAVELSAAGTHAVSLAGNWSAGPVLVGVAYTSRYRFSEQHIKDANNVSIATAKVKIRRMAVSYVSSGYFRVEVTPPGRDTLTYPFTGKVLGVSGVTLGSPSLSSGTFRFPVMADSRGVIIELVNDSPLPSVFQNAEWEGEVVVQARRG